MLEPEHIVYAAFLFYNTHPASLYSESLDTPYLFGCYSPLCSLISGIGTNSHFAPHVLAVKNRGI